jgi:hypothetical protein
MEEQTSQAIKSTRIAVRAALRSLRILGQELAKLDDILDAQPQEAERNGHTDKEHLLSTR